MRVADAPLLEVRELVQEYPVSARDDSGGKVVHAVSGVSFVIGTGETLGVVGETGCGKSSLARSILQTPAPVSGAVVFNGLDIAQLKGEQLRRTRQSIQMVFQDPYSSLDPKLTVRASVEEPLIGYGLGNRASRRSRVNELLEFVGLDPANHADRRPRQLSGGQCQRVAIARALTVEPQLIICDEPVSSLDVLIQGQILNLFEDLRRDIGVAYLFISHDLGVVKQVSDRVAVMYLGKFCELAETTALFHRPRHPYTVALLAANPHARHARSSSRHPVTIAGDPPSPIDPPSGCRFRTRCPLAEEICAAEEPPLVDLEEGHQVACHFPLDPEVGLSRSSA